MGEIDTNPIESVQTALSLFGEKSDHFQRKNRSTGSDDEKERELENVLKELSNNKVQLEAKEAAYMQALLELENTRNSSSNKLSTMLKNFDFERESYELECQKSRTRILELESEKKDLANRLSECTKSLEQIPFVLLDLEAAKESEIKAMMRVKELDERVSNLDDAIHSSEIEKNELIYAKNEEIESVKEVVRKEKEEITKLEYELLSKSILAEALEFQTREAISNLDILREKFEINERKIPSQEALIEALKKESNELKKVIASNLLDGSEASKSREEVENLRKGLENLKSKVAELRDRAEQANCRAEAAEKAKMAIEDQLRKWREERQKQKINMARSALREISKPKECNFHEKGEEKAPKPTRYQPLYKVLNMKF